VDETPGNEGAIPAPRKKRLKNPEPHLRLDEQTRAGGQPAWPRMAADPTAEHYSEAAKSGSLFGPADTSFDGGDRRIAKPVRIALTFARRCNYAPGNDLVDHRGLEFFS